MHRMPWGSQLVRCGRPAGFDGYCEEHRRLLATVRAVTTRPEPNTSERETEDVPEIRS